VDRKYSSVDRKYSSVDRKYSSVDRKYSRRKQTVWAERNTLSVQPGVMQDNVCINIL
jgi:hypothetical protein